MDTKNPIIKRLKKVVPAPAQKSAAKSGEKLLKNTMQDIPSGKGTVSTQEKPMLNVDSLRSILCCLCFETKAHVPRVSAFSPFADQSLLSNVIQTCFGVDIKEDDFCTDVCVQCLVRIDITWQFHTKVHANAKALSDLYRSMEPKATAGKNNRKIPGRVNKPSITNPRLKRLPIRVTNASKVISLATKKSELDHTRREPTKPKISTKQEFSDHSDDSNSASDNDSVSSSDSSGTSESDSDSLPEHPFFAEHGTSVYNCHLCPETFQKSQALQVHQLSAHRTTDDEKILCDFCAKWFSPKQFKDHMKMIHRNGKAICTVCGQSYLASNLKRHMLIHTKERPYACKHCPYTCNQSTTLKQHVLGVHMGIRKPRKPKPRDRRKEPRVPTFPCTHCDISFHHFKSLNRHVSRVHMGIKPPPKDQTSDGASATKPKRASRYHLCPVCQKAFFLQSKLIEHLEEIHPERETTIIQCKDCPERFLMKRSHYNHRLLRHSEKTYKCDLCGEEFESAPKSYTHRLKCYQNEPNTKSSTAK